MFLGKEKQYKEIKIKFKLILIYYYQSIHINLKKKKKLIGILEIPEKYFLFLYNQQVIVFHLKFNV
jgi:hypothetical protein